MITPTQKRLVQDSFGLVAPIASTAAALFYQRLFEIDPTLRPMFKGDIGEQGKKLMQALALTVKSLDRPEALMPVLQDWDAATPSTASRTHTTTRLAPL